MSFGVEFENIRLEIQRIEGEIESLEVRENAATTAEERIIIIKQITALETQITALINQQTEIIKLSAGMAQKRLSSANSPFPRNHAQHPIILTSYRLKISVLTSFYYFRMMASLPSLQFALRSPQPLPQVNLDAV